MIRLKANEPYELSHDDAIWVLDTKFSVVLHRLADEEFPVKPQQVKAERTVTCGICEEHKADIVLLPCKHCITCSNCAHKLPFCPLCKSQIQDRLQISHYEKTNNKT